MKVKIFHSKIMYEVENEVNAFLAKNPNIKVCSINLACEGYPYSYLVLVAYE